MCCTFVAAMEERALDRKRIKEEREERKRKENEERLVSQIILISILKYTMYKIL